MSTAAISPVLTTASGSGLNVELSAKSEFNPRPNPSLGLLLISFFAVKN
jgi:hypothetical protein